MADQHNLQQLEHIRSMMEKSSRFISLSGKSGIAAGASAVGGAAWANWEINRYYASYDSDYIHPTQLMYKLILIAALTFIVAFIGAFAFTYFKSKKDGTAIFGLGSRKLAWNTLLPMIVGGLFILILMSRGHYYYIAPASLIFYGLGLVNGSKYTLGEVRYLGYINIVLGLINCLYPNYTITCWALGFGVAHILYGIAMWVKYDRTEI
jgi:hypothetical protein